MSDTSKNKDKYSEKRQFGNFAEDIASMFLMKRGHKIIERNYLKKWGELDIVSRENNQIHFIEVKSQRVSCETNNKFNETFVSRNVSQGCFTFKDIKVFISRESDNENGDDYRPEENVHFWKQKRIIRAIQTYLLERKVHEDQEWQIDIITTKVDFSQKTAILKHIENVVFT